MNSHKVVWSYCLYGRNIDLYYKPMLENLSIAIKNNICVIIFTRLEDEDFILSYFSSFSGNVKVVVSDINDNFIKLHRYLASSFVDGDYYFYKDTDSIVSQRELFYSKKWMISEGSGCMLVRDHPLHLAPIMGGMFALNHEFASKLAELVFDYGKGRASSQPNNKYLYDQQWLGRYFYPLIRKSSIVYTSFFHYDGERTVDINLDRDKSCFIGCQRDMDSQRISDLESYSRYYNDKTKLSLPYIRAFSDCYQKVRLVLFFAKIVQFFR